MEKFALEAIRQSKQPIADAGEATDLDSRQNKSTGDATVISSDERLLQVFMSGGFAAIKRPEDKLAIIKIANQATYKFSWHINMAIEANKHQFMSILGRIGMFLYMFVPPFVINFFGNNSNYISFSTESLDYYWDNPYKNSPLECCGPVTLNINKARIIRDELDEDGFFQEMILALFRLHYWYRGRRKLKNTAYDSPVIDLFGLQIIGKGNKRSLEIIDYHQYEKFKMDCGFKGYDMPLFLFRTDRRSLIKKPNKVKVS
jgi:hypothetical protein